MKRLLLLITVILMMAVTQGQSQSLGQLSAQDLVPLLDRNIQQMRSGDIRYTVRLVPSERARKLFREALRDPSASSQRVDLLRAFATQEATTYVCVLRGGEFVTTTVSKRAPMALPQERAEFKVLTVTRYGCTIA